MPPRPPRKRSSKPRRTPRPAAATAAPTEIQDAYLRRSIAEIGALQDRIASCERCHPEDLLPVSGSGSPQADIFLVKWSASVAEQQEGVAFFGRAGTAILKSIQRLGIDPLTIYGTLCVKCSHLDVEESAHLCPPWLVEELAVVNPKLVVPMGERVLETLNGLRYPLSEPLRAEPGVLQRWTPTIEALYVPDIDESLDEQAAKRAFWQAFRAIGEWHAAQPPY